MDQPADVEAVLRVSAAAVGGRKTPYRAPCDFGLVDTWNDVFFEFIDKQRVSPEDTVNAKMWFLCPQFQAGRLYDGFEFTVHEGSRTIATGRITKVINSDLQRRVDNTTEMVVS